MASTMFELSDFQEISIDIIKDYCYGDQLMGGIGPIAQNCYGKIRSGHHFQPGDTISLSVTMVVADSNTELPDTMGPLKSVSNLVNFSPVKIIAQTQTLADKEYDKQNAKEFDQVFVNTDLFGNLEDWGNLCKEREVKKSEQEKPIHRFSGFADDL